MQAVPAGSLWSTSPPTPPAPPRDVAPVDEPQSAAEYAEVRYWGELVHGVDPDVPLVVSEVNPQAIDEMRKGTAARQVIVF